MPKIQPFTVVADLPPVLQPLRSLASNLWWTWNYEAKDLFLRLAKDRSNRRALNPIELVNSLAASEIAALTADKGFLAELERAHNALLKYRNSRVWWTKHAQDIDSPSKAGNIAYFSLEFALHESLNIYSGGLGVLAGDHLKAASDLGLPLVAVGLLYYEGYFSQYLNADGWQQEAYPQINPNRLPISPALSAEGEVAKAFVTLHGKKVEIRAWKVEVGTVPLYLLDTNIEQNDPLHRTICARLYGGDLHQRIQQEIVLGIGGMRILEQLGYRPLVFHMNEGHSAYLVLEQMRVLILREKLSFEEALRAIKVGNLFTTHTPVPAGNDSFPSELVEEYFADFIRELSAKSEQFLALGKPNPDNGSEPFSMPALALNCSAFSNGVSALHGEVSRRMWHQMWPQLPVEEVPIGHITNGVHTATWVSPECTDLFDRYLGPQWREEPSSHPLWIALSEIPDEELWHLRCRARALLINFCRERLKSQLRRRGAGRMELESAKTFLDPEALTIGFARRFATYKRATLVIQDIERLAKIVSDAKRPVQFIFAGKAHPADHHGKEFIARLVHASHHPQLRGKLLFVEDYDVHVAAHLVQGVDVWLNTPRRPLEASGTSGMKAAINGVLNFSVLDGWWNEGFSGNNGWPIGQGENYEDQHYQDQVESRNLYDLLEREIIPTFYNRNSVDVPVEWLHLIRHSMRTIAPQFSACRMVQDYSSKYYLPILRKNSELRLSHYATTRPEVQQISHLREKWGEIKILEVETKVTDHLPIGSTLPVRAKIHLGNISPQDIAVEVRYGVLDMTKNILDPLLIQLNSAVPQGETGVYEFRGEIPTGQAGTFGFALRVLPKVAGAATRDLRGLITWWG